VVDTAINILKENNDIMNSSKNQKIVGILCHSIKSHGLLSDLDLEKLSFQTLDFGESLLEASIVSLKKFCNQVYFCVDQELYNDSESVNDLLELYGVTLLVMTNLSPHAAMEAVSGQLKEDDFMFFNQLGCPCDYDGLLVEGIEYFRTRLDQPCIFGEEYFAKEPNDLPELSRNLRSVTLSDSLTPAFVSSSGRLICWTGLILCSKHSFLTITSHLTNVYTLQEFMYEEFNYALPLPTSALDLSLMWGAPAYSSAPFFLRIGRKNSSVFSLVTA
jgi:hypothetical protein